MSATREAARRWSILRWYGLCSAD